MPVLTPSDDIAAVRSGLHGDAVQLVACLCAAWCTSCREFEPAFETLAERHPQAVFLWIDIEDHGELVDGIDVDNFPTIVIQRGSAVQFAGAMPPRTAQIERLMLELQRDAGRPGLADAVDLRARLLRA